jgi:hypothetical protein
MYILTTQKKGAHIPSRRIFVVRIVDLLQRNTSTK